MAALRAEQDPAPAATLRAHLARLDDDLRRRQLLRDRLAEALAVAGDAEPLMKVIETMTLFEGYVHGYGAQEDDRLHDQADTLVELLHADTGYPAGSEVLEVGCGVGAQTITLAQRSPGARITAVDISPQQLAEAAQRVHLASLPNVTFQRADVFALPQADGPLHAAAFDHVFVCFLLEHVDRPIDALSRLRAMVRPGGTITVIEGDHGSAYFHEPDGVFCYTFFKGTGRIPGDVHRS